MNKIILLLLLISSNLHAQLTEKDYKAIFKAITVIESSGNRKALNESENAIGIAQIRYKYLLDANSYLKKNFQHKACYNVQVSYKLFKAYMKKYKAKSYEECARLHNGGPGYKSKRWKTNKYWAKIKKVLK